MIEGGQAAAGTQLACQGTQGVDKRLCLEQLPQALSPMSGQSVLYLDGTPAHQ